MPYVRELPSDAELLRAALAAAPLGVVVFDHDLRYVAVNERLASANGLPVMAHAGRTVREALPVEADYLEPLLRRALAGESSRETWVDIWIEHRQEHGSSRVWFAPVRSPSPDGAGDVIGVLALLEDVTTEVREAAQASSRAAALLEVATRLNTATSLSDVTAALVEAVSALTAAVETGVYALSDDGRGLRRLDESPAVDLDRREKYDLLPADGATPVARAVQEVRALWLQDQEDWEPFPLVAADAEAMGWPVIAVVPLLDGGSDGVALGALYAHYAPPYRLAAEDQQFLTTLAALGSAALSRVTLMEAETLAIEALNLSELRMSSLADAGACGVLEATDTHIVRANAFLLDMLGYDTLPPGGLDWRALTPPGWEEADATALEDLRTRGVTAPYTKEYRRADGTPVPVLLSVATYRTDPFGAIAVVIDLTKQRELEEDQRREVAERERLTQAVQSALFPRLRNDHDWVTVDVGYRAGDSRMALGGDFYDVCSRPDGRLGVVIGDVTGHGPAAAATGAELRAAWRTLTISDTPLAAIPGTLDQMLTAERSGEDDQLMATVGLAALSADGTLETLAAGHPRAIILPATGAREVETPYGSILGADIPPAPRPATTRLEPGDRLLLYTDGLIEARAGTSTRDRLGVAGFLDLLDTLPPGFASHTVLDEVTSRHGGPLPDDAALVILSFRG